VFKEKKKTIMKKTYINPQMTVVKIATQGFLALSAGFSTETVSPANADSRDFDWDEWDE